jgi:BirA family transcriptional regulator, biotin operon repressor / biotin---[acetyl-CoA-carboxylase] ligase
MQRFHFDILDSTSSHALRLVEDGLRKPPFVVSAAQQTLGRGRMGKTWLSPVGGAWFSVAWALSGPPERYAHVPLIAAIAMRRVIEPLLRTSPSPGTPGDGTCGQQWSEGLHPSRTDSPNRNPLPEHAERGPVLRVKWPNDILIDEQKVCGILCEQRFVPYPFIVIGIGVNVNVDLAQLAEHLQTPPTSLHRHARETVDPQTIITRATDELYAALRAYEEAGLDEPANQLLQRDARWTDVAMNQS